LKIFFATLNCGLPVHILISLQVEEECGGIPMVLVQNKIDLIDQAVVQV